MTKAQRELKNLKKSAMEVTDRRNTRIFVSSTISLYLRKKIAEMIRKEVEELILDKELGVITEKELEEEASLLRVVYKSL